MLNIAKGQVLAGSGTVLDVFLTDISLGDALLRDPVSLSFAIFSTAGGTRTQVFPAAAGEHQPVDLTAHKLGTGHFFAAFTMPANAPTGPGEAHWAYAMSSGAGEAVTPIEILAVPSLVPPGYCRISDLREEGVTAFDGNDARLLKAIHLASRKIEQITERWFEPRYCTFVLDGEGIPLLELPAPIIAIESVVIAYDGYFQGVPPVDPSCYRIYARHLTDRMLSPDDRDNPKLELRDSLTLARLGIDFGIWPEGRKNIQVKGVFGYTDFDGSPTGQTPDLLRDICIKLAIDQVDKKATRAKVSGPIKMDKTRDQEVQYSEAKTSGAFTGDADVDMLLESFRRPPTFTAA